MVQIQIIAVGKLKESYLKDGVNEYLKRLKSYAKVEIVEVADEKEPEKASAADEALVKAREAERIQKHIKEGSYLIVLAIDGQALTSVELAKHLERLALGGCGHITIIIGGSLGLAPEIIEQADLLLSFSKMTFPHQLMRLILVEQIYRSYRIINGHSYHK